MLLNTEFLKGAFPKQIFLLESHKLVHMTGPSINPKRLTVNKRFGNDMVRLVELKLTNFVQNLKLMFRAHKRK